MAIVSIKSPVNVIKKTRTLQVPQIPTESASVCALVDLHSCIIAWLPGQVLIKATFSVRVEIIRLRENLTPTLSLRLSHLILILCSHKIYHCIRE